MGSGYPCPERAPAHRYWLARVTLLPAAGHTVPKPPPPCSTASPARYSPPAIMPIRTGPQPTLRTVTNRPGDVTSRARVPRPVIATTNRPVVPPITRTSERLQGL